MLFARGRVFQDQVPGITAVESVVDAIPSNIAHNTPDSATVTGVFVRPQSKSLVVLVSFTENQCDGDNGG